MKSNHAFILGLTITILGAALFVIAPILSHVLNINVNIGAELAGAILFGTGSSITGRAYQNIERQNRALQEEEINQIRQRALREPEKVEPVWDLGRAKLELYFDRNLTQISWIFALSVGVMIVGFIFILFGISQAFVSASPQTGEVPKNASGVITPALISGVSGIITEFIGATFLFLYRSTIQQASNYTKTLEQINAVGMAVKILDTISDESKILQDETKADIVKMLLNSGNEDKKTTKDSTTKKKIKSSDKNNKSNSIATL